MFDNQRNNHEFLRLNPLQSFNISDYPDEKSWEREARNENNSIRDVSRTFTEQCSVRKSETNNLISQSSQLKSQNILRDVNYSNCDLKSEKSIDLNTYNTNLKPIKLFKVPKLPKSKLPISDTLQILPCQLESTNQNNKASNFLQLENTPKRTIVSNSTFGVDAAQKIINPSQKDTESFLGIKKKGVLFLKKFLYIFVIKIYHVYIMLMKIQKY